MTQRLRIAPRAQADLASLTAFIAKDNPYAASRLFDLLQEKSGFLAEFPDIGTINPRRPNRRIHPVGNYLILYRKDPDGITVLRYVHGRRDLRRIL